MASPPTDAGPRELAAATSVTDPMRVAKAFRDAADSIGSWSHLKLSELARACKLHDVTAPVRASSTLKALDDLHRDAWNAALDQVIKTLKEFGGLDGGTEKLIRELRSEVRRG